MRNYVNGFDQLDLGDAPFEFGMNLVQLAKVEVASALLLLQKVGRRNHNSDANNFFIERNKPCPMIFAGVEDKCVILVLVTSRTVIAGRIDHLRKDCELFVVSAKVIWPGHVAKIGPPV